MPKQSSVAARFVGLHIANKLQANLELKQLHAAEEDARLAAACGVNGVCVCVSSFSCVLMGRRRNGGTCSAAVGVQPRVRCAVQEAAERVSSTQEPAVTAMKRKLLFYFILIT
jgi:hypothetical protein